jgi:nucleotidyltransferase substrate binding protein (TIGR01987 family)
MTEPVWRQNFQDLGDALDRLSDILAAPVDKDRFIIDGTIQRFEFCIELFWKNFKNLLELEGKEALSPKQAVAQAYQMKWFDQEALWLSMLNDRNITSHTYKKYKADAVYQRIKTYYPEMRATYELLTRRLPTR